jgi:hypothetical protein
VEHGDHEWLIRVITGDDVLRQERLTRELYEELQKTDGVGVGFVAPTADTADGRKGGLVGDVALWAAVASAGRQASQIMMVLVKEWCARDRHRKVEVTHNGSSVTITGHPDGTQERIIQAFLERTSEHASGDEETAAK